MKFLKNKKILITGGAGFIGSKLINELVKIDCKIYVVVKKNNKLIDKIKNKRIKIIQGNILDINFWKKNIKQKDYLINLASNESKFGKIINVNENFKTNVKSLVLALLCSKKLNKKIKIISFGSENQLGIAKKIPVSEDATDNPITVFGINKLIAEKYMNFFKKNFDIKITNLRLSNVYGPSIYSENFLKVSLNKMIKNLSNGEILLYSNKNCIRDFIYIDDVVKAIILALKNINKLNKPYYYIGSGKGHSLKQISQIIKDKYFEINPYKKISIKLIKKKLTKFDNRNFVANYKNFKNITGWSPKISLQKGIGMTIAKMDK